MTRETIPAPRSRFFDVRCADCGNVQIIYSHAASRVVCKVCGKPLVDPTGGEAQIIGEVVSEH